MQRQIITMVRCSLANATKLSASRSRPHFHEPAPDYHCTRGFIEETCSGAERRWPVELVAHCHVHRL